MKKVKRTIMYNNDSFEEKRLRETMVSQDTHQIVARLITIRDSKAIWITHHRPTFFRRLLPPEKKHVYLFQTQVSIRITTMAVWLRPGPENPANVFSGMSSPGVENIYRAVVHRAFSGVGRFISLIRRRSTGCCCVVSGFKLLARALKAALSTPELNLAFVAVGFRRWSSCQ